jgi:hypothetical protein
MTTPERQRKRQIRIFWIQVLEGLLILAIGIAMLIQSSIYNDRDEKQNDAIAGNVQQLADTQDDIIEVQECLAQVVSTITGVNRVRSGLVEDESKATRRVLLVFAEAAGLVREDPTQPLTPEDQDRLNVKLVKALLAYKRVTATVERERQANPVPDLDVDVCNISTKE